MIAYHLSPHRIRGGFVGVDIFFVISGFLISSIIYQELEFGSFSITGFYVRRVRIYPALFVVLVFVCLAGWFLLLPSDFVLLGKQIVGGSAFVANFVLGSSRDTLRRRRRSNPSYIFGRSESRNSSTSSSP